MRPRKDSSNGTAGDHDELEEASGVAHVRDQTLLLELMQTAEATSVEADRSEWLLRHSITILRPRHLVLFQTLDLKEQLLGVIRDLTSEGVQRLERVQVLDLALAQEDFKELALLVVEWDWNLRELVDGEKWLD